MKSKCTLLLLFTMVGVLAVGCKQEPTPPPSSCMVKSLELPTEPRIPPITEADHVHGPANARITIIEYADFQ